MTVLSAAILATDGKTIDQAGTGGEDWVWLAVFAVLTAVLTRAAHSRWRAARG